MSVRVFDGVDDVIVLDEGTLDTILNDAFTIAVLFKKTAETGDGFQFLASFNAGVNTSQVGSVGITSGNAMQLSIGGLSKTWFTITNNIWYLFVVKKATGTAIPRANLWSYDTDTWAGWTDAPDTLDANATTIVEVRLGNGPNSFPLSGKLGGAVVYTSALSDTDGETLEAAASDWLALSPSAMWRPGMTSPVEDDTGNGADQTSVTGTTTDGADLPDPFDFAITEAPPNVGYKSTSIHPGRGPSRIARFIKRSMSTESTSADSIISATEVIGTASIPTPTIAAGAAASPTTIAGTTTVPTPSITTGATATPATVAATSTIPTPTLLTSSIVSATTVAGSTAIPTPTPSVGSTVAATTVAANTTIPTPVVSAGGSATVIAITVAAATTISTPTIQAGTTVSATTVAGTTSIPAPTIRLGAIATPATIITAAAIPTPTVGSSSVVAASSVVAIASIPSPQIVIITQPTVVACTVTIAVPTISVGSVVGPSVVIATAIIPFPTIVAIIPPPLPADYVIDIGSSFTSSSANVVTVDTAIST